MKKIIIAVTVVTLLASCSPDAYPTSGQSSQVKPNTKKCAYEKRKGNYRGFDHMQP